MLYASICWTACPNLMAKSRIDSSSRLMMLCSELMFPFCRTEHKYWETNAAHNSLNELMDPSGVFGTRLGQVPSGWPGTLCTEDGPSPCSE